MQSVRSAILLSLLLLLSVWAFSNNIKIIGEARVVDFTGPTRDTAVVEVNVSWENSWCDDYNRDAAWVFLKYRKRGEQAKWYHASLGIVGNQVMNLGYTVTPGKTGNKVAGVFVGKTERYAGSVNATVRLKWILNGNQTAGASIAAADFGNKKDSVYVVAHAVEMVYVPWGSYCLGDGFSSNSFIAQSLSGIAAVDDDVNPALGYTVSASHFDYGGVPLNAANRTHSVYVISQVWHSGNYTRNNVWWKIDFKTSKTIRYFGVSGATEWPNHKPVGTWYLQGSNSNLDNGWSTLWQGGPEYWDCVSAISYPLQRRIKVTSPGSYRYYRILFNTVTSGAVARNIAMTEKDLTSSPYVVDGEKSLTRNVDLGINGSGAWSGAIAATYPKGYNGFYCMKYELSQKQYVDFLNSLTLDQQKQRVGNSDIAGMAEGGYLFGDVKTPDYRNGIALLKKATVGLPAIFGHNLNPENPFFAEDDGRSLPCNYLSPADMLAYCDWAGLRPMSEMEYEKACRATYPQNAVAAEYAWNTASGVSRLDLGIESVKNKGTERETPTDYRNNVNSGTKISGPLRCGTFATSRTTQVEAGATSWGVMEMSGNLWEMCYNANVEGAKFRVDDVANAHGDGTLADNGNCTIAVGYWPSVVTAFAVRGGSFSSNDELLRISDRTNAMGSYFSTATTRNGDVGFRAVRSAEMDNNFKAGTIQALNGLMTDTLCYGEGADIKGQPAENSVGKITYVWYASRDNGVSWSRIDGQTGASLDNYTELEFSETGNKTYLVKRKAFCSVGEAETSSVRLLLGKKVLVKPTIATSLKAPLGHDWELPNPLLAGYTSTWRYPDGTIHPAPAIIKNYTSKRNGIYQVFYVDGLGCVGEMQDVRIEGVDAITIKNFGSYRAWEDGTFARSADEYRNSAPPYMYQGDIGSGIYKIDPDGAGSAVPITAYCDMESNGGGWTLLFRHKISAGYWAGRDAANYNVGDPNAGLYSILYLVEKFRAEDGKFLFWLDYPETPTMFNIWKQSDNPTIASNVSSSGKAAGYAAVDVRSTANYWGGLALGGQAYTYLDGSYYTDNWWYSIGCRAVYQGGMPGINTQIASHVRLWVK